MIIESIRAENFRKYKLLDLKNLPESGVIAVSGDNESGKTSIADALSFALFSRTFNTSSDQITKLILWESKYASVTLAFNKRGESYQLTRTLSADGKLDAKLLNAETSEVIANSTKSTDKALEKILGYDYETFADSFYLVQKELTAPNPNSDSIKNMIGIGEYAKINQELYYANQEDDKHLVALHPQHEETYKELQDLGIDDTWMPELVDARETFENQDSEHKTLINSLKTSANEYPENQIKYKSARAKHSFSSILADITLALLVGALVTWGAFEFLPEMAKTWLYPDTPSLFPTHHDWIQSWILPIAIGLALLFFILLLLTWRIEDQSLAPLKEKSTEFKSTISNSITALKHPVQSGLPERVQNLLGLEDVELSQDHFSLNKDEKTLTSNVMDNIDTHQVNSKDTFEAAHRLELVLQKKNREVESLQGSLRTEIDYEMERTDIAGGIRRRLNDVDSQIRQHSRNLQVQNTAIDLLQSSAKDLTQSFNHTVTQASADILPYFTAQRYKNIRIEDNLMINVFSEEKNGFMDFDEISSGTQRQIMLALRIAMSEELARNTNNQKQFIMLDEPFAFFDHDRTVSTLDKIAEVSDIISQVWLFSQEFPAGTKSTLDIHCPTGDDVLSV